MDSGSDVTIISEDLAQDLLLKPSAGSEIAIRQLQGTAHTLGSATFEASILGQKRNITAQILPDFRHHLLLGQDSSSQFDLVVDLTTKQVFTKEQFQPANETLRGARFGNGRT